MVSRRKFLKGLGTALGTKTKKTVTKKINPISKIAKLKNNVERVSDLAKLSNKKLSRRALLKSGINELKRNPKKILSKLKIMKNINPMNAAQKVSGVKPSKASKVTKIITAN